jgi:hypothetical protein
MCKQLVETQEESNAVKYIMMRFVNLYITILEWSCCSRLYRQCSILTHTSTPNDEENKLLDK